MIKPALFDKRPVKPQGIAPMTNMVAMTRLGPKRSHIGPIMIRATTHNDESIS